MKIRLRKPDDWHLHVRDGEIMSLVAPHSAREFARALIMPNLSPPVTTVKKALAYRERIIRAAPGLLPFMSLYLTDDTDTDEIRRAAESEYVIAAKLYPAGATTNSDNGVTALVKIMPVLEKMAELGFHLCIHGEVTDSNCDIFDREREFIDRVLLALIKELPELKITLEHISTSEGVEAVKNHANLRGSITAHHLAANRNAMFVEGFNPHNYCLPVLKREEHRLSLIKAATGGDDNFFAGTDSAPHPVHTKESSCGCAGVYTAYNAVELYAQVFAEANALERLEKFMSVNGAEFYGLPPNEEYIELESEENLIPSDLFSGENQIIPFRAGTICSWKVK